MAKEEVGHALLSVHGLMHRFIDSCTHKQKAEPLPRLGMWLIHYLDDNRGAPVYMRDVERRLGMTRSTASKLIDQLDRAGLVRREADARDMRLRRLVLTEKAEAFLQTAHEDHALVESTLTRGFTEAETAEVLRYLDRMRENIDAALSARQNTERSETSLD